MTELKTAIHTDGSGRVVVAVGIRVISKFKMESREIPALLSAEIAIDPSKEAA